MLQRPYGRGGSEAMERARDGLGREERPLLLERTHTGHGNICFVPKINKEHSIQSPVRYHTDHSTMVGVVSMEMSYTIIIDR
jgi:hypothetical protein